MGGSHGQAQTKEEATSVLEILRLRVHEAEQHLKQAMMQVTAAVEQPEATADDRMRAITQAQTALRILSELEVELEHAEHAWMREAWREHEHTEDMHERAAARARANDFKQTDGKDWT